MESAGCCFTVSFMHSPFLLGSNGSRFHCTPKCDALSLLYPRQALRVLLLWTSVLWIRRGSRSEWLNRHSWQPARIHLMMPDVIVQHSMIWERVLVVHWGRARVTIGVAPADVRIVQYAKTLIALNSDVAYTSQYDM